MIAPILPKAKDLPMQLRGKVEYVLIDKMNYHYADWVYRRYKLEYAKTPDFFTQNKRALARGFAREGVSYQLLF
jgi:hypothetical protein